MPRHESRRLSAMLQLRLSPAQHEYLVTAADESDISAAALLRALLDESMSRAADAIDQREHLEQLREAGMEDTATDFARDLGKAWTQEHDLP